MKTIATYRNLMSAELAKTRLESCDIKALIADVFSYTLGYGAIMDGVRLQVPDADAGRAKEILDAEEYVELPQDNASIAGAPEEAGAISAGAGKEPAACAASGRSAGWPALLLFLFGIFCLTLGRPASDWQAMHAFSGQLVLLGEMLIVAGLWIAYGRLSAAVEHETPPE